MSTTNTGKQNSSAYPRLILIGCGAIAECFYLPAIAKYPEVKNNVILVDTDISRAQTLAAKFNIQNYTSDYQEYLGMVDGAIIAVPNRLHYPISNDFLAAGSHVLCEKPLTEDSLEAKELIEQAKKYGVALGVNQTRRLFPSYSKIKELISSNEIGEILSIRYFEGWKFSWPTASGFYFNTKISPKGILMDIGVHVMDAICWWLGEKPSLLSFENDSFGGPESVAFVKFKHNKCLGEIKLSRLSKLQNTFCIIGEKGMIESGIEAWGSITLTLETGKKARIKLLTQEKHFNDFADKLLDNFIDVIVNGAKPLVPASEVVQSLEFIEECYLSATRLKMPWYDNLTVPNAQ